MLRSMPVLRVIPAAIFLTALTGCAGDWRAPRGTQAGSAEPSTRMAGMYEYMADAGRFTDCASGKGAPVAMEADNAALERAYLSVREEAGEAVLVTLEGHIALRAPMEGEGTRDHLIVERFERIWPGETCRATTAATPLENTYWKLEALGGDRVEVHPDQREVHILLRAEEKRVTGFAGCNQFMAGYETDGRGLAFGPIGSTMMACPYLDEETELLGALEGVTSFVTLGGSLVLSGDSGDVARFRAITPGQPPATEPD